MNVFFRCTCQQVRCPIPNHHQSSQAESAAPLAAVETARDMKLNLSSTFTAGSEPLCTMPSEDILRLDLNCCASCLSSFLASLPVANANVFPFSRSASACFIWLTKNESLSDQKDVAFPLVPARPVRPVIKEHHLKKSCRQARHIAQGHLPIRCT